MQNQVGMGGYGSYSQTALKLCWVMRYKWWLPLQCFNLEVVSLKNFLHVEWKNYKIMGAFKLVESFSRERHQENWDPVMGLFNQQLLFLSGSKQKTKLDTNYFK